MPIQVGLSFFRGMYDIQWELMLAGTLIALVPTLIIFALGQRYFTEGITLSGWEAAKEGGGMTAPVSAAKSDFKIKRGVRKCYTRLNV